MDRGSDDKREMTSRYVSSSKFSYPVFADSLLGLENLGKWEGIFQLNRFGYPVYAHASIPVGLENLEKSEGVFQSEYFEQTGEFGKTQNTQKFRHFQANIIC